MFCSVTWEVASQTGSAAKHLPQEGGVVLAVLLEHLLQGLGPVELVQHDGGCKKTHRTVAVVRNGGVCFLVGVCSTQFNSITALINYPLNFFHTILDAMNYEWSRAS